MPALAHMTCIAADRAKVEDEVRGFRAAGIENILCLRGDSPPDTEFPGDPAFRHAVDLVPEEKKPTACISCGKCARSCPQNIRIPEKLKKLAELLETIPSWAETCRQREAAAKAGKKKT